MADTQSPDELNNSSSAQEFPHKMRVHALARLLGLSSREVLVHLADMGIAARSPQSSIVRSTAIAVRDKIAAGEGAEPADSDVVTEPGDTTAPAAETEAPAAEVPAAEAVPADEAQVPVAQSEAGGCRGRCPGGRARRRSRAEACTCSPGVAARRRPSRSICSPLSKRNPRRQLERPASRPDMPDPRCSCPQNRCTGMPPWTTGRVGLGFRHRRRRR